MTTTVHTPFTRRVRTTLGRFWNDGVAAQEALLRLTPHDERFRRRR